MWYVVCDVNVNVNVNGNGNVNGPINAEYD